MSGIYDTITYYLGWMYGKVQFWIYTQEEATIRIFRAIENYTNGYSAMSKGLLAPLKGREIKVETLNEKLTQETLRVKHFAYIHFASSMEEAMKAFSFDEDFISSTVETIRSQEGEIVGDHLEHLNIKLDNQRANDCLTIIAKFYPTIKSLKLIDIRHEGLTVVPTALSKFPNLEELEMDCWVKSFPKEACNLKKIKKMHLPQQQLESLPEEFGDMTTLEDVNLTGFIDNLTLKKLPTSIGRLVNLKSLNISENLLEELPPAVFSLTSLEVLNFSDNCVKILPPQIGRLSALKVLDCGGNFLRSLPDSLVNCEMLTSIALYRNCRITSLPRRFREFHNLESIGCSEYNISPREVETLLAHIKMNREDHERKIQELSDHLREWFVPACASIPTNLAQKLKRQELAALYDWLNRLKGSADFQNSASKPALIKKACAIIQTVDESKEFRELFFPQVIYNNSHCGDRAAMAFNEIYVSWKIFTLDNTASTKDKFTILASIAKTLSLRAFIQQKRSNIGESVEIFLYYEQHLKDQLGLETGTDNALYANQMGQLPGVPDNEIIDHVMHSYVDVMLEIPACQAILESDAEYIGKKDQIEKEAEDASDTIEADIATLTSQQYSLQLQDVARRRAASLAQLSKTIIEKNTRS